MRSSRTDLNLSARKDRQLVHYPSDAIRERKRKNDDADASRHPLGNVVVVGPAFHEIAGDEEREGGDDETEH